MLHTHAAWLLSLRDLTAGYQLHLHWCSRGVPILPEHTWTPPCVPSGAGEALRSSHLGQLPACNGAAAAEPLISWPAALHGLQCLGFLPVLVPGQSSGTCMVLPSCSNTMAAAQVHEKSILMPLLPLTMLALEHPAMSSWLPIVGMFSMYPLIRKDGLSLAYAAMMMLWTSVASPGSSSRGTGSILSISWTAPQAIAALSILGGIVVHGAHLLVPPPDRYPFMYDAAYIILSAAHHITAWLYLNWQQWRSSSSPSAMKQD